MSHLLDDLSKWKIEMLAKFGGFSHRYIASTVFGKRVVTDNEIHAVAQYLCRHEIKLGDWRSGTSPQATSYAQKVTRPKRRKAG